MHSNAAGLHAIAALHQGLSTTPIQEAGGHLVNVCMGIQGHFLRSEFVTHSFVCPYLYAEFSKEAPILTKRAYSEEAV